MTQLLCHLWGDYILQSDWMAENKTKADLPAVIHALLYSLPFVFFCHAAHHMAYAWTAIFMSHFFIDRLRLARYVVWAKNWMAPPVKWFLEPRGIGGVWTSTDNGLLEHARKAPTPPLSACPTGYPPEGHLWMNVWLLIIADNTLHLTINYLALRYL